MVDLVAESMEEWSIKESTAWLLLIEEESTADLAVEAMKEVDSAVEVDTGGVKDVRV